MALERSLELSATSRPILTGASRFDAALLQLCARTPNPRARGRCVITRLISRVVDVQELCTFVPTRRYPHSPAFVASVRNDFGRVDFCNWPIRLRFIAGSRESLYQRCVRQSSSLKERAPEASERTAAHSERRSAAPDLFLASIRVTQWLPG